VTSTPTNALPVVRGRYNHNAPLASSTWFRVGGPADVLFRPIDSDDLSHFLKNKPESLPITILGAGSNCLVRAGGIRGIVIKLGSGFSEISAIKNELIVGAACLDRTVAMHCSELGLSGLEFLVGIPGTIGGAIAMNAGAYNREIKDSLLWIEVIDHSGKIYNIKADDLKMTYRHSELPEQTIVLRAAFHLEEKASSEIEETLSKFLDLREEAQPIRVKTGGSTFKNPKDKKAWELIDAAGCRGLRIGDAQVSEKHCNFLLNLANARSNDLEDLGTQVQMRVLETSGVKLEWEIIRLGEQ
jgi:UDP-N-acetylmuramate dehydrogenase